MGSRSRSSQRCAQSSSRPLPGHPAMFFALVPSGAMRHAGGSTSIRCPPHPPLVTNQPVVLLVPNLPMLAAPPTDAGTQPAPGPAPVPTPIPALTQTRLAAGHTRAESRRRDESRHYLLR